MNEKDLIPFETGRAWVEASEKQAAYQDLRRLVEAGLYVPRPPRGPWGWCVTDGGHQIVLPVRGTLVCTMEAPGRSGRS